MDGMCYGKRWVGLERKKMKLTQSFLLVVIHDGSLFFHDGLDFVSRC